MMITNNLDKNFDERELRLVLKGLAMLRFNSRCEIEQDDVDLLEERFRDMYDEVKEEANV